MDDLAGSARRRGAASLAGAWVMVLGGCGSSPTAPPDVPAPTIVAVAGEEKGELAPAKPAPPLPQRVPAGYVELDVGGVVSTPGGHAVILVDEQRGVVVPIFIGGTEALSIQLRHKKQRYARPLTHDLLDAIVDKLGGELVRIQIDAIRDDTFVGAVFVRKGDEIIEVDARPSDAIALAIGNRVPIYKRARISVAGVCTYTHPW